MRCSCSAFWSPSPRWRSQTSPTLGGIRCCRSQIRFPNSGWTACGAARDGGFRQARHVENHGPLGVKDPGRIHFPVISLKTIILNAYDIEDLQIAGPGWMASAWLSLDATMPPETTEPQFRAMLQTLLADRFGLVVHRESKDTSGYVLVVSGSGSRMQQGTAGAAPRVVQKLVQLAQGGNSVRIDFRSTTMKTLADTLQARLKQPIVDGTGCLASLIFRCVSLLTSCPRSDRAPSEPKKAEVSDDDIF